VRWVIRCSSVSPGPSTSCSRVDACAPLGAYIAITGTITVPALLLFLAVTVWVAGFDILYALMDVRFDVDHDVRSFPQRFGEPSARVWLSCCTW